MATINDLNQFFSHVEEAAKRSFAKFGKHLPMFYAHSNEMPNKIALVPAPWKTSQQKSFMLGAMRHTVDIGAVDFCCFVTEVWFATEQKSEAVVDFSNMTPPSQRPDRQEMLMIIGIDKTSSKTSGWEIKRDKKKPRLVEFGSGQGAFESISGGFRIFTNSDGTMQ